MTKRRRPKRAAPSGASSGEPESVEKRGRAVSASQASEKPPRAPSVRPNAARGQSDDQVPAATAKRAPTRRAKKARLSSRPARSPSTRPPRTSTPPQANGSAPADDHEARAHTSVRPANALHVEARGPARERSDVEARGSARERSDVEARGSARERSDVTARGSARERDLEGLPDDDIWSDELAAEALPADRPGLSAMSGSAERPGSDPAARLTRGSGGDRLREAAAFGSSQSLLSTDYYFRQYGAHGMRSMAAEVDDFGFDPHVDARARPLLEAFCKRYFRVELVGAEHVPERGRALLVANRSGALPWDGLVLRTALRACRPTLAPLRWLAEDSVIHTPFMGVLMNRLGAVRACPENAERLLAQDRLVAVFPEGAQGSRKLFRDRYRLQRFGRGGYVKLALKFGIPILPTAIIGAEETNPVLRRSRLLGRLVGAESVPITPTFPWLGVIGLVPAPVRWRIVVGEPIDVSSYGAQAADDALVVHRLNEQIRSALQALVDRSKTARGSALFG